ncbi:MAG TPA: diguanylate cyclase, partial [Acidimicrobiia bacterium]|nr:diguanylate cyclase [Acidimicrobiia bacterium]
MNGEVGLDAAAPDETGFAAAATAPSGGLSPALLAYAVGPIALALLLLLRHFGLVSKASGWMYAAVILGPQALSQLLECWKDAAPTSWRLHVRVAVHVAAVTSVIYLSGWGPALGMAYAFSAFADLQQSGASAWPAALGWSLAGCATGQLLVLEGWMPSFLSRSQAQTIGFLGAFVFGIAIRMAGAIGEYKERAEAQLADRTLQAARARDDAERSAAHHRAVVENAAEGILTVGLDGTIRSFNAAAEAMFGWSADEIVGRPASALIPPDLHDALGVFLASCRSVGNHAVQRNDVEIAGVRRDGSTFPMMLSTSAIAVESAEPIVSAILRDLSDQKRYEAQLAYQVLHDALTGLPNRVMLTDRLEQALARLRRGDRMFGVLFVDLDRFKVVNDTLGHTIGDQLLVEAAARIQASVRETDTVARLGGDEFVALCEDIDGVNDAIDLAQRIRASLEHSFHLGDDEPCVSASIGIALCSDGNETADSILANADIAMYRAKDNGRNCCELFDEAMQQWVTAQAALESDLRQAVTRQELELVFQPFVEADSGLIRGFEALVRWQRPGVGLVMPDSFIPLAEESGLIVDIGAWVLEHACGTAAEWARRWPDKRLGVAVNVSSRQLLSGEIV